jgi:hypothetical protein
MLRGEGLTSSCRDGQASGYRDRVMVKSQEMFA